MELRYRSEEAGDSGRNRSVAQGFRVLRELARVWNPSSFMDLLK